MATNLLSAIRALQEPNIIQKSIDDYRHRIQSSSNEDRESLIQRLMIAERMCTIKSQFNRYSDFIEHCLVSNSWYVHFSLTHDGSFEDLLYQDGDSNIHLYAVLFSRLKINDKTPLFFIRLDGDSPIEYGLYDESGLSFTDCSVEQIFSVLNFHLDYNTKLLAKLPTYEYSYTGSIPVEASEIGVHRNINSDNPATGDKVLKLYYGTSMENHDSIKNDGIPPGGMASDKYDIALQIAYSEAGGKDKNIIVYEIWVDPKRLSKAMPMVNVSGNADATLYMLQESIADTSKMKLKYKSADHNVVDVEETKHVIKTKNNKVKEIMSWRINLRFCNSEGKSF